MPCIYKNVECAFHSVSHCFECDIYSEHQSQFSSEELWDMSWKDDFTPVDSIYDN